MNKQTEKPGTIEVSPATSKEKEVSPVSNYVFLHWWNHFDWDLYVKILKAKSI